MNQKIKNDVNDAELKIQLNNTMVEEEMQVRGTIPPYKLAVLFKHADRIITQLVNIPSWQVTYDDIAFVLEMVLDAVKKARNRDEH